MSGGRRGQMFKASARRLRSLQFESRRRRLSYLNLFWTKHFGRHRNDDKYRRELFLEASAKATTQIEETEE